MSVPKTLWDDVLWYVAVAKVAIKDLVKGRGR